jgi:hypothetical protein
MHDLQSKPTKNTHVADLFKKQTIGKEVVEHTHTHTHIHTYIQMSLQHMHTHTHTHTQLLLQFTFIASLSIMVSSHVLDMASIVPYK